MRTVDTHSPSSSTSVANARSRRRAAVVRCLVRVGRSGSGGQAGGARGAVRVSVRVRRAGLRLAGTVRTAGAGGAAGVGQGAA